MTVTQPSVTVAAININEVVAHNVRRIREEKAKLTVAELAERLGVDKHKVYDYERPRQGSAQREFTVWDLSSLCVVLETNLFELLLPPEGVVVEELGSERWLLSAARAGGLQETDDLQNVLNTAGRREVGWVLFGVDGSKLDPDALEAVAENGRKAQVRREKIVERITKEMWERIGEELQ